MTIRTLFVRTALAAGVLALTLAAAAPRPMRPAGTPAPAPRSAFGKYPPPTLPKRSTTIEDQANAGKLREDEGAFGAAVKELRALRGRVAPDADLELGLALDEARSGDADSAWARLATPLMRAALADTAPPQRWHEYTSRRSLQWVDGKYTGWHWYVAHARAELALQRGDWRTALESARLAAAAQPLVGREHLLVAVAAGRAGEAEEARREAELAAWLDPMLPEASYLAGLWAWRAGERTAARNAFQAAIASDSSYREPGLALVRLQLPGARPDTLPSTYLTGIRRVAMLTSAEQPKPEENVATDTPAGLYGGEAPSLVVPDSLKAMMKLERPIKLYVTVLVDEKGRPALSYFPYLSPSRMPLSVFRQVMTSASAWKFKPATRLGQPVRAWISVEYWLNPHS